jgi:hypothetical protein
MSVEWIAKNPKPNVINYANQVSMHDSEFSELIKSIIHVFYFKRYRHVCV